MSNESAVKGLLRSEDVTIFGSEMSNRKRSVKRQADDHKNQPLLRDLASQVNNCVAAEKRRVDTVKLSQLIYNAGDRIATRLAGAGALLTAPAFSQLMHRCAAPPYAAGYLGGEQVPPDMRAPHASEWIKRAIAQDGDRTLQVLSKLRSDGERIVYAFTSESYVPYDMDSVIVDLAREYPSDSRASLVYDANTTRWSLTIDLMREFEATRGEIHRLRTNVRGSDAARATISFFDALYRLACLNGLLLPENEKRSRARHTRNVAERVAECARLSSESQNQFSRMWRDANVETICEGAQDVGADRIMATLVHKGYVSTPGVDAEDLTARLMVAWRAEPGYTRAAFVNAITRAAHTETWRSVWATEDLEAQAGQFLYQGVRFTPGQIVEA